MKTKLFLLFLLSSLQFHCEGSASHSQNLPNPGPQETERAAILKEFGVIVDAVAACQNSDNNSLSPHCEWVDATWTPSDHKWFSGPRVLVMETNLPMPLLLGRYKHRFLAVLYQEEDGTYVPRSDVTVQGIRAGFVAISELTGTSEHYFTAQSLHNTVKEHGFSKVFSDESHKLTGEHSIATYSIIGEYVPSTSFVYAPPPIPKASLVCSKNFEKIETFARKAGTSLVEHMRSFDVSFMNMSGGESIDSTKRYFSHLCHFEMTEEEALKYLKAIKPFYEELAKEDVLIIQAANRVVQSEMSHNIPDCDSDLVPNRIRVLDLLDDGTYDIPKKGQSLSGLTSKLLKVERAYCADVLVAHQNSFHKMGKRPLRVSEGFMFEPIPFMCPSWAAPTMTAFLASRNNDENWLKLNAIERKHVILGQAPSIQLLDPLRYGQFEVYEWGLLEDESL
ncbi:MAG: hypothetical protein HYW48_10255 [Deltaproteobacteria bacterium]|nr:hypothetical protein [Deltaproteobacteria bacterium]